MILRRTGISLNCELILFHSGIMHRVTTKLISKSFYNVSWSTGVYQIVVKHIESLAVVANEVTVLSTNNRNKTLKNTSVL